ncbi:MAG TPA: polyprenol monophosphomannose synthase [Candidatus Bilamarchaeum sp.]|nr:polyprenol monophosphomannose synthase [Candidatus Bilamarchaeum sp.]
MLSIVIPTYNERENIRPLVESILSASKGCEIVFVDDASPDGTASEIRLLAKKYPNVRLVERPGKLGLTSAVVAGVEASGGQNILVMDADLSHPPAKVPELEAALASCDLVVGSRMARGGGVERWPLHRKLISRGAELLARLAVGKKTSDPLSGLFAVRREVFQRTRFRTKGYKLLLNIIFDNPGMRIGEVPYIFTDRRAGKTKLGTAEILRFIADLWRIRFG